VIAPLGLNEPNTNGIEQYIKFTFYFIMPGQYLSLTNEYNVSIPDVSETLKKLINKNHVIKLGDKYVIKNKTKLKNSQRASRGG